MYTFDVFDTVITRNTATPVGIFALVERELLKNSYTDIPARYRENFFFLRRNAERLAICVYKEATSIDIIYQMLGSNKDISTDQLERIKKLELETEYANSIPINENIEKIRRLQQSGEKIIFISDMYLSSEHIRRLICKYAPDLKNISIYVSCEHGCNKLGGELFEKVKESENLEFKDWIHTGDNLQADIRGAEKKGITAQKYDYPDFHLFEKKLLEYYENDASLQVAIGIARNVRMKKGIAGKEFNNEFVYGCSYGAPMIYSYVAWVLKQCAEKGIKRLYFVSRDGYVPKIVADYLIKRYELDIQTKYIYGSRKAWMPIASNIEFDLDHYPKLRTIANYFDIAIEDIRTYIPNIDSEAFLTAEQLEEINKNINFKKYLVEMQKDKFVITKRYLLQELDFSDDNFAFVEIQGAGSSIAAIVLSLTPFYQGIFRSFWNTCYNITESHNFDMCIYLYKNDSGHYFENMCRAPHGLVMGYEEKNGKIVPIFGDRDYENFDFEAYIDGVNYFTVEYADLNGVNDSINVFTKYFNAVLQQKDYEVMDFHSIFFHSQLEFGNASNQFIGGSFIQDVILRLNLKFSELKIAVYGAGKLGKEFRLVLGNKCVAWFDLAYEDYLSQGYNVHNPYEINVNNNRDFDVIIVAIADRKIFDEVKKFLISILVSEEKIFWIKNV
jgi:FMN phosphatase YigB (HAD superfamily)